MLISGRHEPRPSSLRPRFAGRPKGRLLVPQPAGRGRLPPGQTLVYDWPVLDLGTQPNMTTPRLAPDRRRVWSSARSTGAGTSCTGCGESQSDLRHPLRHPMVALRQCLGRYHRPGPGRLSAAPNAERPVRAHPQLRPGMARRRCRLADFIADGAMLATHWDGEPHDALPTAARSGWSSRSSISGNPPNGYGTCGSPTATPPAIGKPAAITNAATRGANNGINSGQCIAASSVAAQVPSALAGAR